MSVREVAPRPSRGEPDAGLRALRSRWRTASLAAGWPFPADWALPEVDAVCRAVLDQDDVASALVRLGHRRAETGASLAETLQDLAALHAVLETEEGRDGFIAAEVDAVPARLLRVVALGWAEEMAGRVTQAEATDGLTGLATASYLRTRLREAYAESAAAGEKAEDRYALAVVAVDLSKATGWSRVVAMVLVADVLRLVFNRGETLAVAGPSVGAVLLRRDHRLPLRLATARWLVSRRLAADPDLGGSAPLRVWVEALPATHQGACELVNHLGRG
ncbi:GGDEF domain-containing protein [Crossiella equi]|uniref:GGDEF domain-containing protein n=1 Tax=Crossiella equi TaxID=130796 RepID=A0ABS5ADG6_9PSEU|nr:GGDEF domain-containing protein [Crossiella equi]MBP2474623.1 GGDEF domain-containing protein [Crossiella equi]